MAGEDPAAVIWRDAGRVAFLDHRPVFAGHALVVPAAHRPDLETLAAGELGRLVELAAALAAAMERGLGAEGAFIAINQRVSQSVPHVHVHVVPRRRGDGLRGFFWPRTRYASEAERVAVRERIAAALVPPP